MTVSFDTLAAAAAARSGSAIAGQSCAWLEACGYKGVEMLLEALAETPEDRRRPELIMRLGGVDGGAVSAVFLAPRLIALAREHGRISYRNARHGLYVLPLAVEAGLAIGCPVDPAFSIGGEREAGPYAGKLAAARTDGINIDPALWARLAG